LKRRNLWKLPRTKGNTGKKNLNITAILMGVWAASQGSLIVYVVIIWFYARYMNELDQEHGLAEIEED